MLRLVFSPPEFPFGHHVILLILSHLFTKLEKLSIFLEEILIKINFPMDASKEIRKILVSFYYNLNFEMPT